MRRPGPESVIFRLTGRGSRILKPFAAVPGTMSAPGPAGEDVLVTGGAGFIGSHLAERLAERNAVTVFDSLTSGSRDRVPAEAELIEADLRDRDRIDAAMAASDRVFHLAAMVDVARSVEAPLDSHGVNVEGTLTVFEAARRHDVPVIVASSAAIYGRPSELPIPEEHPSRPLSPYGLDKLAVDQYARLYHDLYGLPVTALRYFNVYGPGQTGGDYAGVIATFLEQAAGGGPLTVEGDGTQTRDFVHVSDVVRANLLAADADVGGQAINVGTGEETSIRELAETIRELTDGRPEIVHVDPRPGDIDRSVADLARAEAELRYRPDVDLPTGLESMFRSDRNGSSAVDRPPGED